MHRHDRAVIAEDFRDFAEQLPEVIRAETLPLLHPDAPAVNAAGVISVVVFPAVDIVHPNAPLPDLGLLRRVAAALDARRLVTTELYVIPPTYRQIAVSAGVAVSSGYQVDAVRRWVELILRQYLAPVPPFGPDGRGWPLGRTVRRAELEAVAVQVEGVDYLEGLLLAEIIPGVPPVQTELVNFQRWELPALAQITVVGATVGGSGAGRVPLPTGAQVSPAAPLPIGGVAGSSAAHRFQGGAAGAAEAAGPAATGGLLMHADRSMSLIVHPDQWLRCAHHNTALLDGGGVTLTWSERAAEGGSRVHSRRARRIARAPSAPAASRSTGGAGLTCRARSAAGST